MAVFLQRVAKIFMFLCAVTCTLAAAVKTTMMGYLLAILAIVFLYVGCVKKRLGLPQISRVSGKLIVVLIIVGGGALIVRGAVPVPASWDVDTIFHAAEQLIREGHVYDEWSYYGGTNSYFMQYSNNRGLFFYLYLWLRVWSALGFEPTIELAQGLSVLSIAVGVWFTLSSAECIFDNRGVFLCGSMILTCIPIYFYGFITYSDTMAFPYAAILCYLILNVENHRCILYFATIGFFAALGYIFKPFLVALVIAIGIYIILKHKVKRVVRWLSPLLLTFCICVLGSTYFLGHLPFFDYSTEDAYKFPVEHWLMLGLSENGNWNAEDYGYTYEQPTYEDKRAADRIRIVERLSQRDNIGKMAAFYFKKTKNLFSDPALKINYSLPNRSNGTDAFFHAILETSTGRGVLFGWQMILLIGILLGMVNEFKNELSPLFIVKLAFLGEFLILMLWEQQPRYLFHYYPAMIIMCVDGLLYLINFLSAGSLRLKRKNAMTR